MASLLPPWRPLVRGAVACCMLAGAQDGPASDPAVGFQHLWAMVVVGQAHRGVDLGDVAQVRRVCQYGLTRSTAEIAAYLLLSAEPRIDVLELLDVDAASGVSGEAQQLHAQLDAMADSRLQLATDSGLPRAGAASHGELQPTCDLVLFSEAAPRFSIDRVWPRLGKHVVVAWVSEYCVAEEGDEAGPVCNLLNTMWEKTLLMRRGYCTQGVCAARVPSQSLRDPNTLPLECERFVSEEGSNASVSEFGQDWFAYWNFFRGTGALPGGGTYVDVGASLPFEYSNTVILDRCLGWRGVCIEPNPHLVAFLQAYRSCQVVPNCIEEQAARERPFSDREGNIQFTADCLALGEILDAAGLAHQRIDVLSIDVEHGELKALQGLDFDRYDIRVIIVEVTRGARWLEVDSAVLPWGYAKVAILGRDVVFAKLEDVSPFAREWPLLREREGPRAVLPSSWSEFNQRVIDEELVAEMQHERRAFYAGLRRTL